MIFWNMIKLLWLCKRISLFFRLQADTDQMSINLSLTFSKFGDRIHLESECGRVVSTALAGGRKYLMLLLVQLVSVSIAVY